MILRQRAYWIVEEVAWGDVPDIKTEPYRFYSSRNLQDIGNYIADHLPKGFRVSARIADTTGDKATLQLISQDRHKFRIGLIVATTSLGLTVRVAGDETFFDKMFNGTLAQKPVSAWVNKILRNA